MYGLITLFILLTVGLVFGRINEANHYTRLAKEEAELSHILTVNLKSLPDDEAALEPNGVLVTGNVVVAVDYFKVVVAGLKMLIGGRLRAYESLIERARRESIVRMKKQAEALGATAIYNVRIEYSNIGHQPKGGGVELLAYGTAVKHHDNPANA